MIQMYLPKESRAALKKNVSIPTLLFLIFRTSLTSRSSSVIQSGNVHGFVKKSWKEKFIYRVLRFKWLCDNGGTWLASGKALFISCSICDFTPNISTSVESFKIGIFRSYTNYLFGLGPGRTDGHFEF